MVSTPRHGEKSRPTPSPFARLAALLDAVAPGLPPIDLSLGEPKHPVPDFVGPVLAAHTADFGRYPPIRGTPDFREAVARWLDRRFGAGAMLDAERGILPLNGSREGLFSAALAAVAYAKKRVGHPAILLPNPFYPVYAAAAEAAGAEPVFLPAGPATGFLPDLTGVPADVLARTVAIYYASPANPQGAVASRESLAALIRLAGAHDILVFSDECYSELYRGDAAPPGILEAAADVGRSAANLVAFNSLSKRSNLPGLRCGFAAGDPDFLAFWAGIRNVIAPQVPMPVQAVAVAALGEEAHVAANRRLYDEKFAAAAAILGTKFGYATPPGGFFLWLDMTALGGGEAAALRLWRNAGVKVVPGSYLAAGTDAPSGPGWAYVRVAMVESLAATEGAMRRLAQFA